MSHKCVVKYIYPGTDVSVKMFLDIDDFVYGKRIISHSSYEELHSEIEKHTPTAFELDEPIAMYHEVLWLLNKGVRRESDILHHAIEEGEYGSIKWGIRDNGQMMSVCVDMHILDIKKAMDSAIAETGFKFSSEFVIPCYIASIAFGEKKYVFTATFDDNEISVRLLCDKVSFYEYTRPKLNDLVNGLWKIVTEAIESYYTRDSLAQVGGVEYVSMG
jgi:hypothetical protein